MPTKHASSAEGRRASQGSREQTGTRGRASATRERDEHYALISVLYHALQGAETCESYIEDGRKAGDQVLTDFFEETRAEQVERAERAKQLLAERLEAMPREEGDEDEEEDDYEEQDDDDDDEE